MSSGEILQLLVDLTHTVGILKGDMASLTTKMEDSFLSLGDRLTAVQTRLEVVERSNKRLDDNLAGIGVNMTHLGDEVLIDIRNFKTSVGKSLRDVEDDQVRLETNVRSFASKDYVDRWFQTVKDMVSHEQSKVHFLQQNVFF